MKLKTNIVAEKGKQEIYIHRTFDLPVHVLFRAYTEADIVEQWMGTKVLKLENKNHGSYHFETKDQQGNILLSTHGVIHEFEINKKITRTFEMKNTPFPVQLEYLQFEEINDNTSKLTMHVIYKSVADRDALLKLPFAQGINMAHNKLQEIANTIK